MSSYLDVAQARARKRSRDVGLHGRLLRENLNHRRLKGSTELLQVFVTPDGEAHLLHWQSLRVRAANLRYPTRAFRRYGS